MPEPGARAELAGPRADEALSPLWPMLTLLGITAVILGLWLARRYPPSAAAPAAPQARFTDATAQAGLAGVSFEQPAEEDIPGTLGGAVAFFDYDNDGRPDLLVVRGRICRLFHNEGGGRFRDVTEGSGLRLPMPAMSIAIGDYDGDGREDIFITGIGGQRLFRNLGGGRFADVTASARLAGDDHVWSSGAVWVNVFGQGRLDLVVCNYARWPKGADFRDALNAARAGPSYGAPVAFASGFPTIYRNLGGGRFAAVTRRSGLELMDRQTGFPRAYPLAVAAVDAGGGGRLDLLFTYQSGPDALFLNQGGGSFARWTPQTERREGISAGLATPSGLSIGREAGNVERLALLRAAGLALSPQPDSGAISRLGDKLGVALLDYDLDGRVDLFNGNGMAELGPDQFPDAPSYAARPRLLWNDGREWKAAATGASAWTRAGRFRGIAVADVYGDGRPDVVLAEDGGGITLLRNDDRSAHAWLRVELVASHGPRDGDGARVEVRTRRRVYRQTMEPAMGLLAQSERRLTFGLGDDARIERVVVLWPSGIRQEIRSPEPNRLLKITEPSLHPSQNQ